MGKNKKRKNRNNYSTKLSKAPRSSNLNTYILVAITFVGAAVAIYMYS